MCLRLCLCLCERCLLLIIWYSYLESPWWANRCHKGSRPTHSSRWRLHRTEPLLPSRSPENDWQPQNLHCGELTGRGRSPLLERALSLCMCQGSPAHPGRYLSHLLGRILGGDRNGWSSWSMFRCHSPVNCYQCAIFVLLHKFINILEIWYKEIIVKNLSPI